MDKEILLKFETLKNLIGNTPMVKITYEFKGKCRTMFAKLEWYNFSGSIKDRPAFEILYNAYLTGELKPGQTICETTSGNMGISLCAIANFLGNPVVICMPKTMSEERKKLLTMYGAKLELTEDFDSAFSLCESYKAKGAFLTSQFENNNNFLAHFHTTANEIHSKIKQPSCFVSGVGTGGTLMGVGKYLKQICNAKIIAVDPLESSLLKTKSSQGQHKIQGLSDGRIPKLYDEKIVDDIISIKSDDAIAMAQKLCKTFGLCVGISSGANFLGCVLCGHDNASTVFADDNKKYLSTDLSKAISSDLVDKIKLINFSFVH